MDRTKFNCPWATPTLGSGFFNLQVAAGRWIVLAFLDRADSGTMDDELDELFRNVHFDEDRVIFCGIVRAPQSVLEKFAKQNGQAISFVADPDGTISRSFGATDKPRLFVLDPAMFTVGNGTQQATLDAVTALLGLGPDPVAVRWAPSAARGNSSTPSGSESSWTSARSVPGLRFSTLPRTADTLTRT